MKIRNQCVTLIRWFRSWSWKKCDLGLHHCKKSCDDLALDGNSA